MDLPLKGVLYALMVLAAAAAAAAAHLRANIVANKSKAHMRDTFVVASSRWQPFVCMRTLHANKVVARAHAQDRKRARPRRSDVDSRRRHTNRVRKKGRIMCALMIT